MLLSKKHTPLILALLGLLNPVYAIQTVFNLNDSGPGSLRQAIVNAAAIGGDTIDFTPGLAGQITLASPLPFINTPLTINGNSGITVNSSGSPVFFLLSSTLSMSNLTITGVSVGGTGNGPGGGALGAGGGLFINTGATANLNNITFLNNQATGGNGGNAVATLGGGGGGGFNQGTGGGPNFFSGGAGGGGFGGIGGQAVANGGGGGGGSIGFTTTGLTGFTGGTGFSGGGGGAGAGANGSDGTVTTGGNGGSGGLLGGTGGTGGGLDTAGTAGTGGAGGGGGGAYAVVGNAPGGAGGSASGGGGGGGNGNNLNPGGVGANGSFGSGGGGGGGGSLAFIGGLGGNGGDFGGGGGGGASLGVGGQGGNGGFGGGGGGGGNGANSNGGTGGFGAGNGAAGTIAGVGNGGNGGSAFGGAVFVRTGGTLNVLGGAFTTNATTVGVGGEGVGGGLSGLNGTANGNDLFLMASTQAGIFVPATTTLTTDIAGFDPANISTGGSLAKAGAGSLVITTANSPPAGVGFAYNGPIAVSGGNLTVGSATTGAIIGSSIQVNSADLIINTLGSVFGNIVQNGGNFLVLGSVGGTVNLNFVNGVVSGTISNTVTANHSLLRLNNGGTITGNVNLASSQFTALGTVNGAVNVDSASLLTGTGTVGSITSSGTVKPGIGIGTMIVTGGYTQLPTGIIEIAIASNGITTSSSLLQTGSAAVSGTLKVDPQPGGLFLAGSTYNFLTSTNVITGQITHITGLGGAAARINQFPNLLQLQLLQNIVGFTALGGNAGVIQRYLESAPIIPGSDLAGIVQLLNTFSDPQLIDALNRLSPAQFAGNGWASASLIANLNNQVLARGNTLNSCLPLCPQNNQNGLWIEGVYDNLQQHPIQQLQGFRAISNGLIGGYDLLLFPSFKLGVAGGHTRTNLRWQDSYGRNKLQTTYLGAYAFCKLDQFQINASFLGGWQQYHNDRTIIFPGVDRVADSKYNGKVADIHLGLERTICAENGIQMIPFGGVDYIVVRQNQFSEEGALSLNLDVARNSQDFLRSELGVTVTRPFALTWGTIVPKATVSWICLDPLTGGRITGNFTGITEIFTVNTAKRAINLYAPCFELDVWRNNGLGASASYLARLSDEINEQEVCVSLSWRF